VTHLTLPDGTVWPDPADPGEVQWQLRYGDPTSVRMLAASYVDAYRELCELTGGRRSTVVSQLREASALRHRQEVTDGE